MALPDEFIQQLRNSNPINDVFSSYVSIKRYGNLYKCSCPFHSEKTPSCTIYIDTQSFYCFGCGAGGDVIKFIERIENLNYIESIRFLAERAGLDMPSYNKNDNSSSIKSKIYEINRETANFYYQYLISGADKRGLAYFKSRQLLPQTIKKYGLGYSPDNWNSLYTHLIKKGFRDEELISANVCRRNDKNRIYDSFRGRVIFPIIDLMGNVIAFGGRKLDSESPGPKYINSADTPVFKKSRNLFSLNFAKNSSSKKLILAEGYMDVISINQAGFENVVATLGTALTQEQARKMSQYANEVIIAYDSDIAGQAATHKAINYLSDAGVNTKIIKMENAKDPDEYIKKFGSEKFRLLLDNSGDAINFEIESCKTGLILSNENDQIMFLRKSIAVISELEDSIQRDVYISKLSRETNTNTTIIRERVDELIKKKKNIQKNAQWKLIEQSIDIRDEINPEAHKYKSESRAEEFIILYIIKNPENINNILTQITPEEFITSFNRKVFQALKDIIPNTNVFSISLLSENFSAQEMGKICGIEAKNRNITISDQTISDCIEKLKNFNKSFVHNKNTEISDQDLLMLQKQMKNKK